MLAARGKGIKEGAEKDDGQVEDEREEKPEEERDPSLLNIGRLEERRVLKGAIGCGWG